MAQTDLNRFRIPSA